MTTLRYYLATPLVLAAWLLLLVAQLIAGDDDE